MSRHSTDPNPEDQHVTPDAEPTPTMVPEDPNTVEKEAAKMRNEVNAVENQTEEVPEIPTGEPQLESQPQTGTVEVKKGDTLRTIADANNTTVKILVKDNDIDDPNALKIGDVLKVRNHSKTESRPNK